MENYPRTLRELESRFASEERLLPFLQEAVEPGSVVISDGLQSYRVLSLNSAMAMTEEFSSGAASRRAPQTLADGHPSGRGQPSTSRLLPRRIHVPVQPASLTPSGQALLPALQQGVALDPVLYAAMARGVRGPKKGRRHNSLGYLSEGNTHLAGSRHTGKRIRMRRKCSCPCRFQDKLLSLDKNRKTGKSGLGTGNFWGR